MAHDRVFVQNTVGAVNVSGHAGDFEGDVDVVHLGQGDLFGEPCAVVLLFAEVVSEQLALRDLTQHPRQFVLHELVGCDGVVELDARKSVGLGAVEARHGRAERTPGNTVASVVQAGERTAKAFDTWQHPVLGNLAVLEHQFAGDAGFQRVLSFHFRC